MYGLLSIIFYKTGHFKFNFLYFDKKPLLFLNKKIERKNAQNSKMSNISKKHCFTTFKSTCGDVISFANLAKKS